MMEFSSGLKNRGMTDWNGNFKIDLEIMGLGTEMVKKTAMEFCIYGILISVHLCLLEKGLLHTHTHTMKMTAEKKLS